MKYYITLICLLLPLYSLWAQDSDSLTMPFEGEALFETKEVPARYQNEWGVVLGYKYKIGVITVDKHEIEVRTTYRARVKVQDRAALEYFSEFRMQENSTFKMKVLKADGKVLWVDTSDAVSVKEGLTISTGRSSLNLSRVEYEKVAVRSLEIGDIVDYSFDDTTLIDRSHNFSLAGGFLPEVWGIASAGSHVFGDQFPTLTEELEIEMSPEFYLNFRSLNGADNPVANTNEEGNSVYLLRMDDIESHEEAYFIDEDKSLPRVDYEVSFCRDFRHFRSPLLLGAQGELTSESSFEQVKKTVFLNCQPYKLPRRSELKNWMRYRTDDPEDYMRRTYRKLQWEFSKYESSDYVFPSFVYANIMYAGLKKRGFDPEIIVCVPESNGGIDKVLFRSDLVYGVRVPNEKGEYIHSFAFKKCSSFDDWDYRVVGSKAYAFKPQYNFEKFELEEIQLPAYEAKNNLSAVELDLKLNLKDLKATVSTQTEHHGELKTQYAEQLLTPFEMAEDIEWSFYGISPKYSKIILDRIEEIENVRRNEMLEAMAGADFEVLKYKGFELEKSGMEWENDVLQYNESYVVGDLVTQATETDYVVDIGRLIGAQIALTEKDMERRSDVYVDFVRKYQYSINFKIPEGYEIANLSAFRCGVQTDAGFFTVKINIVKSKINLVVTKRFSTNYLPNEKWPEMAELMDAAHSFSQQKIVFTKIEE